MIISMIAFFAMKLTNDANYEMICMSELLQTQPASRFSLLLTTGGFFCFPYSLYPVDLKKIEISRSKPGAYVLPFGKPFIFGLRFCRGDGRGLLLRLRGVLFTVWLLWWLLVHQRRLTLDAQYRPFLLLHSAPLLVNYDDRASCILPSPVLSGLSIKKVSPNGDT